MILFLFQVKDLNYAKAINCVIEMRLNCVARSKPDSYNCMIKNIKSLFKEGSRSKFWEQVGKISGVIVVVLCY